MCAALDPLHPRGTMPLVDSTVQPLGEEEGTFGMRVTAHAHDVRILCASAAERDAWLSALRAARLVSAHRVYISELAKDRAESGRDVARRERDAFEAQARELAQEVSANEAAALRAPTPTPTRTR